LTQARQQLSNNANGAGTALLASPFMQAGGMLTAQQMHFPRPNPGSPLPGSNSAQSITSRYGMWGGQGDPAGAGIIRNNNYGPLGL